MQVKTPISSTENPIFMLLILINVTYGSDTNCRIVFNNFTVGFLSMLVFQTIWRNKNEHKTEIKMKKEEKSVFKVFREIYRRTIMKHSSRSDSNGLHRMVKNGTTFLFPNEKSRFVT